MAPAKAGTPNAAGHFLPSQPIQRKKYFRFLIVSGEKRRTS
jgi:hypothetical protein